MRKRRLKRLWKRLHEIQSMKKQTRDDLLMRLGAAKKEAGRVWSLVNITTPAKDEDVNKKTFTFSLNWKRFRQVRRREGRNPSNLPPERKTHRSSYLRRLHRLLSTGDTSADITPTRYRIDSKDHPRKVQGRADDRRPHKRWAMHSPVTAHRTRKGPSTCNGSSSSQVARAAAPKNQRAVGCGADFRQFLTDE
jgi:hypothetical protein